MIPIKLTIEGLYSYQEPQSIDFSNLTQAGLFGIFGKVGSGKSSIIEAISFALYGESERLNSRDNRAYNMMNLKSNQSVLDFEFYNFQDQKFRIYRSFKRNSKKFDDVKRVDAILYKWQDDQWIPQPSLNMVEVIGLSYENFKRTIIIPQGKFKEFIELGGKDRTKMMQEIFGLDRFDLLDKVKKQASICKGEKDQLNGQLLTYSTITPILIKEKKVQLAQQEKLVKQLNEEFLKEQQVYEKLKLIQADVELLEQKNIALKQLTVLEPEINAQKQELDLYEDFSRDFSGLLSQKKQNETSLNLKKDQIKQTQEQIVSLENKLQRVSEDLIQATQSYENLDMLKNQVQELGYVSQVSQATKDIKELTLRIEKGEVQITKSKQELEILREQYTTKAKELESAKAELVDTLVLMQMENWFTSVEHIEKTGKEQGAKVKSLHKQINEVDGQIHASGFTLTQDWSQSIEQQKQQKESLQNELENQLRHLKVSLQLEQYANELKPGAPCPLCGSSEHPKLVGVSSQENQSMIIHKEKEIQQVKDSYQHLLNLQGKISTLFDKRALINQNYHLENQILNDLRAELTNLRKNYQWKDYCENNLEAFILFKAKVDKKQQFLKALEQELTLLIKQGESAKASVDKYVGLLSEIQMNFQRVNSELQANKNWIKTIDIDSYLDKDVVEILKEVENKNQEIVDIEQLYITLNKDKQQLSVDLSALQNQKQNLSKDIIELDSSLGEIVSKINVLLQENNLQNIQQVQQVLEKQLDVKVLREKIQEFYVNLELLKVQIQELQQKVPSEDFDLEGFKTHKALVEQLQESLQEKNSFIAVLRTEKERLVKDYALKVTLQEKYEALDARLKNIQVLDNMFKAAGFVNYVSGIYLSNLCNMANIRFHRLTNNQLSLQLNSANEFEILDYLNDGKPRSVKTLSGGQVFQVSLSLALALAESVQSLSKSNKNFFFIDEGFGTQDTDSVNVVFETLQNLQKENRIVGIISHVDELQDRIPVSLTVVKDQQKGSVILDNI